MKRFIFTCIWIISSVLAIAQNQPNDIAGVWKSPANDIMIKIDGIGGQYQGRIVWIDGESSSQPVLDAKNPVERLRNMPLKGNRVIQKLSYNSSKKLWENGTYYHYKEGKTYTCQIQMTDKNKITVIRYNGNPAQGTKEVWTRHK